MQLETHRELVTHMHFRPRTSLNGLILVCMMKGNLQSSHESVSEAVSHCCRHDWWTYLRLPEQ